MNQPVKGAPAPTHIRIENLTEAAFGLPAVAPNEKNPKGWPPRELGPGGYNVPLAYVTAIRESEVTNALGQKYKPHAEFFEKNASRIRINPDPKAVNRPEGVEPPDDLSKLPEAAAEDFVLREQSLTLLEKWLRLEKRANLRHAIAERIAKVS